MRSCSGGRLARKQTRDQQERQRPDHFRWRRLEEIREPYKDSTGPHADGVVQARIGIKPDLDSGHVGLQALAHRIKLAECVVEDSLKMKI